MCSDEDELYPSTWVPEIITRGPVLQREGSVNELQLETPLGSSEGNGRATHPISHCRSPYHVVIDIPEPDMTPVPPVRENTDLITMGPVVADTDVVTSENLESEATSIRRSVRERRPPCKLTYDELGEPLILAINSSSRL